ncbi:MAG: hypothetical protein O2854_03215 [Chloroflexi bacterium]|nr:hypothetical protein [Chloroflexota bacterium]
MPQGKLTFSKGATYDKVEVVKQALLSEFPYFAKTIDKRLQEFGIPWLVDFEMELNKFFGEDEERLHKATRGYGQFSLDAMKMQKRFDKTRKYPDKTYADALRNVYLKGYASLEAVQILMDGKRSCLDIADELNIDFFFVHRFGLQLQQKGLISCDTENLWHSQRHGD